MYNASQVLRVLFVSWRLQIHWGSGRCLILQLRTTFCRTSLSHRSLPKETKPPRLRHRRWHSCDSCDSPTRLPVQPTPHCWTASACGTAWILHALTSCWKPQPLLELNTPPNLQGHKVLQQFFAPPSITSYTIVWSNQMEGWRNKSISISTATRAPFGAEAPMKQALELPKHLLFAAPISDDTKAMWKNTTY